MQISLKYRAMSASNRKPSYVLSFLLGVTLMLAFSKLGASNPQSPHHVYELRLYHVNEGKMDALKARFGDRITVIVNRPAAAAAAQAAGVSVIAVGAAAPVPGATIVPDWAEFAKHLDP